MKKSTKNNLTIKKLSTENKELYGSVKPTEISKIILENQKLEINPSMIQLTKEIKSLGDFKVKIDLHSQIQAVIDIKVVLKKKQLNNYTIFSPDSFFNIIFKFFLM